MLPRTRGPLMRSTRSRGVPLPFLLAAVMGLPLVLWLFMLQPTADPQPSATDRLLDKLQQHGLAEHTDKAMAEQMQAADEDNRIGAGAAGPGSTTGFLWASTEQIAAAGTYLQEVVMNHKQRPAVAASKYVIPPEPHDMRAQYKQVADYLNSPAFKAKVASRQAAGQRGIIINAGGPHLVASTIVTLKVLREELNCSLPVELVWHSPAEMDSATLTELRQRWGPIMGVSLSSIPWPHHQRPKDSSWNGTKFLGKVQSLTTSSFASALLLDADNLPLANPIGLWEDASFKAAGNLFWPDFWVSPSMSEHLDVVFDMVGLKHSEAEALLAAGKGRLTRDTESGQLLLDLVRHADVAELALWINSFGDSIYNAVWGDKDTYGLAFAVAGKAHEFNQLQVPPAAALTWRPDQLLLRATGAKLPGWQLAGMVQYDALGQPAFLHRTMNKFSWEGEAWHLGLITAPLPLRWINYYLSQEAQGPTVGVPFDYVAPDSAFVQWHIPPPLDKAVAQPSSWTRQAEQACPVASFTVYWQLREHGVAVGGNSTVDMACAALLKTLLGANAHSYQSNNLDQHPELLALGLTKFDQLVLKRTAPNPLIPAEEVPDSTPVLAWVSDYMKPAVETAVTRVLRSSYQGMQWLQQHADAFALLSSVAEQTNAQEHDNKQQQPGAAQDAGSREQPEQQ